MNAIASGPRKMKRHWTTEETRARLTVKSGRILKQKLVRRVIGTTRAKNAKTILRGELVFFVEQYAPICGRNEATAAAQSKQDH